jgi:hypothetical protein
MAMSKFEDDSSNFSCIEMERRDGMIAAVNAT